jgi:dipeptidyl aminopeptidase/acylaminoacyl peptidase
VLVGFDPVADDAQPDPHFPASLVQLSFDSHGSRLNGVLYQAAGQDPHPTVLVLHGFPGFERNLDLAQAFRRAGWNALVFHYRGAWGSQGDFAFAHVLEDVKTALEFVRSDFSADQHGAHPEQVALVGHSMGGWASLMTASEDESLLGAAFLAGWNVGLEGRLAASDASEQARLLAMFDESLAPLHGTDSEPLLEEARGHRNEWNLLDRAHQLAGRSLLIVGATRDAEVPLERHHTPLVEALRAAGAENLTVHVWETDHAFSDHRIALARATADWLGSLLPAGT